MKAILFDMDGTLVDTKKAHIISYQKVLKEYGLIMPVSQIENCFGILDICIFKKLLREQKVKGSALTLSKRKKLLFLKARKNSKLFPGTKSLIKKLKKKYKIGLATSSSNDEIKFALKNLGLNKYFDATIGREDVKKHKPNPEAYKKLAKKLKVKLRDCIVIEDSPAGVKAAKNAGMFCIAVLNSFPKNKLPADLHIKSLKDKKLLKLLKV